MVVEILDRELQEASGLPLSWFDVLAQLVGGKDGKMPMKQLAGALLLSKSGITRLIDRMEGAGLVRRHACPSDGRVVYAAVTQQGKATFRKAAPVAFQGLDHHFSRHISQEEAEALVATLTKILDAAQRSPWMCNRANTTAHPV